MFQAGQFYGRGAMLYQVPPSPNTPADIWLGHSGGLPGASAVVAWSVTRRAVVAVALTGDGPVEALANRLLAVLDGP
jgi:D-alanyl-D-alanine carboxypeptidase